MHAYLNGEWLDERSATVSIDDAGLLSADGVYETARLHHGRYFRLGRHLDRLAASAAMLRIAIPSTAVLTEIADQLVRLNEFDEATLRIVATRGVSGAAAPTLFATLRSVDAARLARAEQGWTVITARTRRPPQTSLPASLKCLGRTFAVIARLEAHDAGADDALLLSVDGCVAEGPTWNVFWRRGRTLFTPRIDVGVLEGVTRSVIIELAANSGFGVEEVARPRTDLDDAEEVFATMSSVGIASVRALDGRHFDSHTAARILNARYWDLVDRECRPPPG